jgi:hypothetical protein
VLWYRRSEALSALGRFAEAASALRTCRELDPASNPETTSRALSEAEDLDARMPAILAGKERPRDTADALRLAEGCRQQGHFSTAVHLFEGVLPGLSAEDVPTHLHHAACAAARAATRAGESTPEAGKRRAQALAWLRDGLSRLESLLRSRRFEVVRQLKHWQRDPDLSGLRDAEALSRLPPAEKDALVAFWARVEQIALDRAGP